MTSKNLLTALYEKMSAEQAQYRQWLLGQSPKEKGQGRWAMSHGRRSPRPKKWIC